MKNIITLITIIFLCQNLFSQNEFQNQMYLLNEQLNTFEKKYLETKTIDSEFAYDKLEIIKDLHRLSEESSLESINKNQNTELGYLIKLTTDIACNRLELLEMYLTEKNIIYKTNFDRTKTIYLSLYLRIKKLEN